jgi:hypothetical protein
MILERNGVSDSQKQSSAIAAHETDPESQVDKAQTHTPPTITTSVKWPLYFIFKRGILDFTTFSLCLLLGHAIIISRHHPPGYDVPELSSLSAGAVGGGVIVTCSMSCELLHLIYKGKHSRPLGLPSITRNNIVRALVALSALALLVGIATLSGVIGVTILSQFNKETLSARHAACASAAGYAIFIACQIFTSHPLKEAYDLISLIGWIIDWIIGCIITVLGCVFAAWLHEVHS